SRGGDRVKTWQIIWQLIRFRPLMFAACLACGITIFCLPIAVGLVVRALFDALTGSAPATLGLWTLLALLLVTEVVGVLSGEALSYSWISFLYTGCAILRNNLLRELLTGYSANRLPSSGEAVSRFRDDVEEVVESIDAWI